MTVYDYLHKTVPLPDFNFTFMCYVKIKINNASSNNIHVNWLSTNKWWSIT